jgi:hypothetical protein
MRPAIHRSLAILLVCFCVYMSSANAQAAREPPTDNKLIALVAGGALSEDTAHEIESQDCRFDRTTSINP